MLNSKALVAAAMLAAVTYARAQPSGLTVQEARAIQGRLAVAELEAKVREAQNRGNGTSSNAPAPIPVGVGSGVAPMTAARPDEIQFVGHYGIEDDLKADFLLNGTLVTFSLNGDSQISGWKLASLTPRQARVCKVGSNKGGSCKTIFLSVDRPGIAADPAAGSAAPVIPLPATMAAAK